MSGIVLIGCKVGGINHGVGMDTVGRDGMTHEKGKMEEEFGFSMCMPWVWGRLHEWGLRRRQGAEREGGS